ncbi:hypothetical protein [Streptomyces sp. AA1529]|uniref:hypothetical protein n=1 Tax=Streptomyces sp. AA1529 TaxID=1203257 RepID=UPI00035E03B9|nr:hypothetical protein [Streptomyces sp. AA1529]
MATEPTRAAALGAALFLVLGTAACSADSDKSENLLKETPLDQACGGIFTQQMKKEAKNPRVHAVKTESYQESAADLVRPDEHTLFASKKLCRITPLEKDKQISSLVSIYAEWEATKPRNGKSTEWRSSTNGGQFSGSLVILCPKPGGREFKEHPSAELSLFDELHLSNNSRAKLLIAAAKKFVPHMQCTNKITYPDPDEVAPR